MEDVMVDSVKSELCRHLGIVFITAYQVLKNREDAEDVTQDVYVEVLKRLESGVSIRNVKCYLARSAFNRAVNRRESQLAMGRALERAHKAEGVNMNEEHERTLNEILDGLPEDERIIMSLHYASMSQHPLGFGKRASTLDVTAVAGYNRGKK